MMHCSEIADVDCLQPKGPKVVQHMALASSVVLDGTITSITIDASGPGGGDQNCILLYVGTATGNIYQAIVDMRDGSISEQLVQSAHCAGVTAVAFPELYGEVRPNIVTGSYLLLYKHLHSVQKIMSRIPYLDGCTAGSCALAHQARSNE